MAQERSLTRREFLGAAAATSAGLTALGTNDLAAAVPPASPAVPPPTLENNVYTRLLGVRPHLGAHEHISRLGGGRMAPEVMAAMSEANEFMVDMFELQDAAGKRAAELLGAPAALITAGGFSSLILGAAACLTGTDQKKIEELPKPSFARRVCLMQKAHQFGYDRAFRAAGADIVYAEDWADMIAKMGEQVAMIAGITIAERQGVFAPPFPVKRAPPPRANVLKAEQLIALGKKYQVPVLIDMASDLPPWDNLKRLVDAGADLIVLSGGKCIGGPYSSGILLGRADLVAAARANATPNDNIGRGMKVGKEEIIGLVTALERFAKQDHQAETERWNDRARRMVAELQGIPGLTVEYAMNTAGFGDADITWDASIIKLDRNTLHERLATGTPRVELEVIVTNDRGTSTWHATARTRVLRDGEEMLVARRLREVFQAARQA